MDFSNELSYMNGNGYLKLNISDKSKSLIFRTRCGLLGINDVPWRVGIARICSLCNSGCIENVYHFIGQCPTLRSYRMRFFKTRIGNNRTFKWGKLVELARVYL